MSAAANAVRDVIAPVLPHDYEVQLDEWCDTTSAKIRRFAVIRHAGGARAELLRRPQLTLSLIGQAGGDRAALHEHADQVIEAMRASSGSVVFLQPSDPVSIPTADGRPVLEIAISAITT